ncbi:hypothetical protein RHSIM_Rhsim06G0003700 [Rhododendron simsii]|uniref:Major facilitator superfamily (MFS) profile domain-containing protein n=1 Tax=Rhododendron simsii TaxID=118357 RepID=A0A834LMZ4_RHOSS|nr:hypothetical protein RHSIM_Rhsim06G0003700 [Rhododendron simsii]
MALKVLSALDSARTQYYHFKAILIAGMGLFTDAYDFFCIPPILKLISHIYYDKDHYNVPFGINSAIIALPLLGTVIGSLVSGRLGDMYGRNRVYGVALILMVVSSIGCGFSLSTSPACVLVSLGFFRFCLGVGIGGDYPLSATIMSEFANKTTRGAFIAAVFSMQGLGILVSSVVTMVVCKVFDAATHHTNADSTPQVADLAWRIILIIGAIPAAMTFYWRMLMPETARYTALVERNVVQAARNMEKVLDVQFAEDAESSPNPSPSYPLFSTEFLSRHGRDLFSCAASWFLVDVVFYSSNLFQSKFLLPDSKKNAFQDAYKVARFQALLAVCSTIPGYWATVILIDRIGRVKIQIMGFFFMAICLFAAGIPYNSYWQNNNKVGFLFLYGLTLFFSNFGPNTTTFIVPAELFPARFRTTCHGISGAFGKVGAIIGTVGVLWATDRNHGMRKEAALIILGGVCVLGILVTYLFMRETKGRSLEENENDNQDETKGSVTSVELGLFGRRRP